MEKDAYGCGVFLLVLSVPSWTSDRDGNSDVALTGGCPDYASGKAGPRSYQ
jgi:hypothetical protein